MGAVTATSSAYDVVQTSLSYHSSSAVIQEKWDGVTREEKENTLQELEKNPQCLNPLQQLLLSPWL